jgi:predicted TIM-barrel fold metal-dependent hydrolase
MADLRIISADSHVMEPPALWQERLDRKFREQAPRVIKDETRPGYIFTAPGMTPFPAAGGFAIGKSGDELKEHLTKGYEAARPSGWDPAERMKDQDIDGVTAEVLYTTLGMPLFRLPDFELQRACFRVYNDWLAELCSYNPKRLTGLALISLADIPQAVQELHRCAKAGLRGAMIWGSPPADKPYRSRIYDPFWEAASELEMPLHLHTGTGNGPESRREADPVTGLIKSANAGNVMESYGNMVQEVQRSLNSFIFGGVLERFPRLRLVSAESDVGWLPHFMYRLDHAYDKFSRLVPDAIPRRPSEYIRRQVWATFQDDPVGPAAYQIFGGDNYMWASDFPHADSTWPHSREVIARDFAGVPEAVTQKIVFDNCAKLYHIDV